MYWSNVFSSILKSFDWTYELLINPEIFWLLDFDASSHELEHNLLLWNVYAIGTKSFNIPGFEVDKVCGYCRHLHSISIVHRSFDELIIIRIRIWPSNNRERVNEERLVWIYEFVLNQEIGAYLTVLLSLFSNRLIREDFFGEMANSTN